MLEIGKHTNIYTSHLKKPRRKIISAVMGTIIAINAYSGALAIKASAQDKISYQSGTSISNQYNDEIPIPDCYRADVAFYCGKEEQETITKQDLANMEYLSFWLEDEPPTFLKECTSLANVIVKTTHDNLKNIEYINELKKLKSFAVISTKMPVELNEENASFLKRPTVKDIKIKGYVTIEPSLLSSIPNLESMTVYYTECTQVNYNSIPNLKELSIEGTPYNIGIYTSIDELKTLKEKGVKISISEETELKLIEIENKLNKIIANLDISASAKDQEKLNKVVLYILEKFTSDPDVDKKAEEELREEYHVEGELYAALEHDTQVCANYAALTSALCKRLNIENYLLISDQHSWNMVKIDDDYYYVDTTWMDNALHPVKVVENGKELIAKKKAEELLITGDINSIKYYMAEPSSLNDIYHEAQNYPSYITKEEHQPIIEEEVLPEIKIETTKILNEPSVEQTKEESEPIIEQAQNITNDEYIIQIDGKPIIIGASTLIGLLTALGVAKVVKKKNKNKEIDHPENKFRI